MLDLEDVRLSYQSHPVVQHLCLSLRAGEVLGLAGESGCGKSTILRYIAGMLPPGAQATGHLRAPRRVGYIPQDLLASLSPYLTVGEQVSDPSALVRLGLGEKSRAYPHQLSGGERQRVVMAMALATGPDLILADEPTAHLDAANEQLVLQELKNSGATLLIASHRERVFRELGCPVHRLTPAPGAWPRLNRNVGRDELVSVRGLTKDYFGRNGWLQKTRLVRALEDVSLNLRAGETVALVGESGAGKSTLARCIAGRETWDAGEIVTGPVQVVPQEPSESLSPRMTIAECLREACGRAEPAWLEQVALPGAWLDRKTGDLSEGQRARVAVVRTMASLQRGLLILDESLSGLDPETQVHVLRHLSKVQTATGLACLLITHDEELATAVGARTVRLAKGRVVE